MMIYFSKTRLFKYIERKSPLQTESFQLNILIFFIVLLKNIECGYSLEPPRQNTIIYSIDLQFQKGIVYT